MREMITPSNSGFDPDCYRGWAAPAYVIAEAGVNHGGNLEAALEMVRVAAGSGIDALKFQTYKAGRIATRTSSAYWDRSMEPSGSQYELFLKYDMFDESDYRHLAAACAEAGITFLTTPFDTDCISWLDELLAMWKVASADITNFPLLRRIARTGKPVILSTGASTLGEVEEAVDVLTRAGCPDVTLLHCTLSYPTATSDANIGTIVHLQTAFPGTVLGYSDHTLPHDSFAAIAGAFTLGARVIEKHFTLDKTLTGNDHWHSFDGADFTRLREELDRLQMLLGQPRKLVLPNEEPARLHARRSLVARGPIRRGELLTADAIDVKRPGTGIEPRHLETLIGWHATVEIEDDTTLQWHMLAPPA